MDSFVWNIILHIRPNCTINDVLKCEWINEYDLFIQFVDGEKVIYDTFKNGSRYYDYDINTITEDEWRNEFKIRLNNILIRTNTNQSDLAKYLNTTQQTISKYCTGKIMPNIYTLHKMGRFFNIDYKELLFQDYSI